MFEVRLQLCLRPKKYKKVRGFFFVKRLRGLLLFIVVLFCFLNKPKIFSPDLPSIACLMFVGSVVIFLILCIPYKFGIAVPPLSQEFPRGTRPSQEFWQPAVAESGSQGDRHVHAHACQWIRYATFSPLLAPHAFTAPPRKGDGFFFPHLHVQLGDKALLILVTQLEELPCLFEHLHLHVFQFSRSAGRRSTRSHLTLLVPLLFCFPVDVSQARTPLVLHLFRAFSPRAGANGRAVGQETQKAQSNGTLRFLPPRYLVTRLVGLMVDPQHLCLLPSRQLGVRDTERLAEVRAVNDTGTTGLATRLQPSTLRAESRASSPHALPAMLPSAPGSSGISTSSSSSCCFFVQTCTTAPRAHSRTKAARRKICAGDRGKRIRITSPTQTPQLTSQRRHFLVNTSQIVTPSSFVLPQHKKKGLNIPTLGHKMGKN